MDPNLASTIILNPTLNATLNQPPQPLWTPLISPFSILAGALIGVFASFSGLRIKERQDKRKIRRQTVSQLRGCQRLLSNLYMTYGVAFSETQYSGAVSKKNYDYLRDKTPDPTQLDKPMLESQAYNQHQKTLERSIILHLELAKCSRDLFEIIGLIETVFPVTSDLNDKILLVENLDKRYNEIIGSANKSEHKGWVETKVSDLNDFLANEVNPAIDGLINHLKAEIKRDDEMSWWQKLR